MFFFFFFFFENKKRFNGKTLLLVIFASLTLFRLHEAFCASRCFRKWQISGESVAFGFSVSLDFFQEVTLKKFFLMNGLPVARVFSKMANRSFESMSDVMEFFLRAFDRQELASTISCMCKVLLRNWSSSKGRWVP